ncbi:hypothetical protein QVD17_40907 [Tagetes erecta]|uniref:Polycomb protein VEFS-Box domain-containing protein n=1 Tax=Tagetes erecta TaxID=13708 RepID=A0AAD8NH53_TARER|nr:hypothetical protein QVD17_40907 [Tagetes erecta]
MSVSLVGKTLTVLKSSQLLTSSHFTCLSWATSRILNDENFAKMKKGVRIVNVPHDGVIDEDVLVRALDVGIVAQLLCISERMDLEIYNPNALGVSSAAGITSSGLESTSQLVPVSSSIAPTTLLQFAKTRKLSIEQTDPRNQSLLHIHRFFHSHRAQPMAPEYVFGEEDSEDEVDDDVADLEDRRMLDDFVDVTKNEKRMMHLWNSFIRNQRCAGRCTYSLGLRGIFIPVWRRLYSDPRITLVEHSIHLPHWEHKCLKSTLLTRADNNGQEDSVIQALNFSTVAATSGFGNSANNVIINNSRFSMTTILPFKVQAEKEKEKTEKEKEKAKIEREKAVKGKIDKENILERMMKMKAMLKSSTKQLPQIKY